MCYLWDKLDKAKPDQTIFGWEKLKLGKEEEAADDPESTI